MPHSSAKAPPSQSPTITTYEIDPDTGGVLIPVRSRKYPGTCVIVDPEDVATVVRYRWSAWMVTSKASKAKNVANYLYVARKDGKRTVYLHRFLLGITDRRIHADHKNHNGLDNRRCNIRVATPSQNQGNRIHQGNGTSQYKGVSWNTRAGKWKAIIYVDGKQRYLGSFTDETDAAIAYDNAAREVFGEFACLNFPEGQAS